LVALSASMAQATTAHAASAAATLRIVCPTLRRSLTEPDFFRTSHTESQIKLNKHWFHRVVRGTLRRGVTNSGTAQCRLFVCGQRTAGSDYCAQHTPCVAPSARSQPLPEGAMAKIEKPLRPPLRRLPVLVVQGRQICFPDCAPSQESRRSGRHS
jgi:hypothetical protein